MSISLIFSSPQLFLLLIAASLVLALVLERWAHLRAERRRNEVELSRLNNLHLLTNGLSRNNNPGQMADVTLERTLQILGLAEGYVLLRGPGGEGLDYSRAKGLSPATVDRLSGCTLGTYLVSCADRWGSLMVFPDLGRSDLIAAWRRDPLFQEFHEVLRSEGLRTLLVAGLTTKERSYGAMVMASRRLRTFDPSELRLMLAVGNQICVALENYFLHKAAERHNEELKILHRVAEELGATFDFGEQLQILRRELTGLLGSKHFYLAFQDSGSGRLETVVAFEDGAPECRAQGDGPAEYVLRTRSPLRIARDFREVAGRLGIASDLGMRTWGGVPIHFSDGSMGVLAVADFEREEAMDERQFELLQVLAGEVAAAIENARLFQREQQRVRHLALLNELGRKATSVLSPKDLLADICQQIRGAFGYDVVVIGTMGSEGELVVDAQEGYGAELLGRRFKLGEGLPGIAAETSEPVVVHAVRDDERYVPVHPGARSALSLPLKCQDVTLGVLSIESFREHGFSQQDMLTLQTLTDQLAIALHNARAFQVAREQAITDGLTGLKTHRYFMEALEAEWRRATRSARPFALIMMDLDRFKQINDRYGHLEGDKVLMAVAQVLEARSRQSNVVARYGGDEFAILMPEATTEQALIVAERVCQSITADLYLSSHGVTASSGLATFPEHGATPDEILRIADSGVYLAKHERGNCVRLAACHLARPADPSWDQHLLEAYLGVAVKRMFSTGPEAFNQYLQRFQQVAQDSDAESVSVLDIVTALAYTIDAKDHYTRGHSQGVSRLATQLAMQTGLSQVEVEEIRLAGIVHDIGKIGVPESILNKPSRLTPEEFEVMKSHAVLGDKILEPLKVKSIERIRRMVRHHHEFVDGQGYPDGLRGEEIPFGARILTIADSFDTMVSDRAYKKGRTMEETAAELRCCSGTQFDRTLVEAFLDSIAALGDPRKRAMLENVAN